MYEKKRRVVRLSFRKWKKKLSVVILVLLETMQVTIKRNKFARKTSGT